MIATLRIGDNVVPFQPLRRPAITLDGVSVRRGRRLVLREIACTIPAGAITAVVGPSGAGKSTFLGLLNGLIPPVDGSVQVTGLGRLGEAAVLLEHRRRTATIFQEHALIDRLTALENVLLGLADRRHPLSPLPWSVEHRRGAAVALAHVGLLQRAHDRAGRLSGGERQRVGFARALVRRPRLMLADEPFSAVDPTLVRHLGDVLRRAVAADGVTVVIVLHQIELARALADRILGLADGRLRFIGPPHDFDAAAEARVFCTNSTTKEKEGCRYA